MSAKPQILVIVRGGVIQYIAADSIVDIYIVNHDDLQEGENPLSCFEPFSVEHVKSLRPLLTQQVSEYNQNV